MRDRFCTDRVNNITNIIAGADLIRSAGQHLRLKPVAQTARARTARHHQHRPPRRADYQSQHLLPQLDLLRPTDFVLWLSCLALRRQLCGYNDTDLTATSSGVFTAISLSTLLLLILHGPGLAELGGGASDVGAAVHAALLYDDNFLVARWSCTSSAFQTSSSPPTGGARPVGAVDRR